MRAVIDTNVLVSGLLGFSSAPARIIEFLYLGRIAWLYDDRIIGEYLEVLKRPKFFELIDPAEITNIAGLIDIAGEYVLPSPGIASSLEIPDPGDIPFVEVALAGKADFLVTGNLKHFSAAQEFVRVLPPAGCLSLLCPGEHQ